MIDNDPQGNLSRALVGEEHPNLLADGGAGGGLDPPTSTASIWKGPPLRPSPFRTTSISSETPSTLSTSARSLLRSSSLNSETKPKPSTTGMTSSSSSTACPQQGRSRRRCTAPSMTFSSLSSMTTSPSRVSVNNSKWLGPVHTNVMLTNEREHDEPKKEHIEFLKTREDPAKALQASEQALDFVAPFVELPIVRPGVESVLTGRHHGRGPHAWPTDSSGYRRCASCQTAAVSPATCSRARRHTG